MGQAGLLDARIEDPYFQELKVIYNFLKHKHQLDNSQVINSKYFRLRPPNFPTIRLSQLAKLYIKTPSLFSKLLEFKCQEDIYILFDVSASSYWDTHYNFGVSSFNRKKKLTKPFIDLLIINTIIPLLFCYGNFIGIDNSEVLLQLASNISSEKNSIIKKFNQLRPSSKNCLHSQALIQLKNEYCNKKKCLDCVIGNLILSN
jgi:hypothetical protein